MEVGQPRRTGVVEIGQRAFLQLGLAGAGRVEPVLALLVQRPGGIGDGDDAEIVCGTPAEAGDDCVRRTYVVGSPGIERANAVSIITRSRNRIRRFLRAAGTKPGIGALQQ
jgi:hypothetical protein